MYPFDVFKDTLELYVFITEKTGMAIQLKTMPIRDDFIPCRKEDEEYVCDFFWLCEKDSILSGLNFLLLRIQEMASRLSLMFED